MQELLDLGLEAERLWCGCCCSHRLKFIESGSQIPSPGLCRALLLPGVRVLPFSRAAIRRCALIRRHGLLELVSQVAACTRLPSSFHRDAARLNQVWASMMSAHRAMAGAEKNAELDCASCFTAIGGLPKPRDGFRRVA